MSLITIISTCFRGNSVCDGAGFLMSNLTWQMTKVVPTVCKYDHPGTSLTVIMLKSDEPIILAAAKVFVVTYDMTWVKFVSHSLQQQFLRNDCI